MLDPPPSPYFFKKLLEGDVSSVNTTDIQTNNHVALSAPAVLISEKITGNIDLLKKIGFSQTIQIQKNLIVKRCIFSQTHDTTSRLT